MKRTLWFVMSSLLCLLLVGCGTSAGDQDASKTLDLHAMLSSSITEVVITSEGKEIHITDSEKIKEVVSDIESAEFQLSKNANINEPGAVSVTINIIMESETTTLTFPCFLYEGSVYSADVGSINLFDKYFE